MKVVKTDNVFKNIIDKFRHLQWDRPWCSAHLCSPSFCLVNLLLCSLWVSASADRPMLQYLCTMAFVCWVTLAPRYAFILHRVNVDLPCPCPDPLSQPSPPEEVSVSGHSSDRTLRYRALLWATIPEWWLHWKCSVTCVTLLNWI